MNRQDAKDAKKGEGRGREKLIADISRHTYSGFQLDEVHARNPVSLRNRVSQYLTKDENRYRIRRSLYSTHNWQRQITCSYY
jgi:hypothetical protein